METTVTAVSYDIEVDKIETEYSGFVKVGATEADYQLRRDQEQAGIDWNDQRPEMRLAAIRTLRGDARKFHMTLTKDEARGFGIGARLRITVELVTP